MRIETNNGGGKNFYSYKQGWFYLKNGTDTDPDYKEVTLIDKEKKEYTDTGVYVSALGGIVSDVELEKVEHEGRSFEVLKVTLDGEDVISMSFPSEAARKTLQQFEKLDFSKPVILNAYLKDGWSKMTIKQDGEHVENSYLNWNAETRTMEYLNGYPERPAADADQDLKEMFPVQEKKFLRALAEKVSALVPEFTPVDLDEVNGDNQIAAQEDAADEDINPEDIPFK